MKTIRELRTEKGLTQLQLAYELGVTPVAVYAWEAGRSVPRVQQLRKMAELFGVSSDSIQLVERQEKKRVA